MLERLLQPLVLFKYEVLLFALIQHLYLGMFFQDLDFYMRWIWPLNMFIVGMASMAIFARRGRLQNTFQRILFGLVFVFPLILPFFGATTAFMTALDLAYVLFFGWLFLEVFRFLWRPGYINLDVLSAAACGYLLLMEVCVFLFQFLVYRNPFAFNGITRDTSQPALVFMDLVYFSSVTLTSIGFGDVTPSTYATRLLVSLVGVAGHFYSVILVGILVGKYTEETHVTQDE